MPGAIIVADQPAGAGSGTPGQARQDLWQSQVVNLSVSTSGNTGFSWELLDRPPGSATSLSTPNSSTSSFTPDVVGTYRIRLSVNGGGAGNVQIRVFRCRFDNAGTLVNRGWALPALGEAGIDENNYNGNVRGTDQVLRFIFDDLLPWASGLVAKYNGVTVGQRRTLNFIGMLLEDDTINNCVNVISDIFRDEATGNARGEARSPWKSFNTVNATPVTIQSISVPIATFGDVFVTVTWEVTVSAATGGGNMARKATFRRNGGVLALINQTDNGIPADLNIATSMTAAVDTNESIKLTGTGIAASVNWIISTHVQIAREPA